MHILLVLCLWKTLTHIPSCQPLLGRCSPNTAINGQMEKGLAGLLLFPPV